MKLPIFAAVAVLLPMTNICSSNILQVDPQNSSTDGIYATIQSAVDNAKPGDTIEIRGGIYRECVRVKNGGTMDAPLKIQAAANQTVVLQAGSPLQIDFRPVPGVPEVYQAKLPPEVSLENGGIWEMPARLRLSQVHSPEQVSQRLASWHYDTNSRALTLRSSGAAPVPDLKFWVENSEASVLTIDASHVEVRGLHVTLGNNGIEVTKGQSHVVIEDCRAFCNRHAGLHISGNDHRIKSNEVFQNNAYGIQFRYGINGVHAAENLCFLNGPNNGDRTGSSEPTDLGIYSQGTYNLIERNIISGIHKYAYRNKASGHPISPTNVLRQNVIQGHLKTGPYGVYDNTILVDGLGMRAGMYMNGGEPSPLRSWSRVDPEGIQRASNLIYPLAQKEDPKFADPAYWDFRLQSNSPYLSQGAYPGFAPVYFVDPQSGSDENSGLSIASAVATPERALKLMPAGGTLYLLPGRYENPILIGVGGLGSDQPLRVRGYGKQSGIVLTGGLQVDSAPFVEIEGLEFHQRPLEIRGSNHVRVRNSLFLGGESGALAEGSANVAFEHCTFVDNADAIRLQKSGGGQVLACLFLGARFVLNADADSVKELYSDFNAGDQWSVKLGEAAPLAFDAWMQQTGQDRQSRLAAVKLLDGFELPFAHTVASLSPDFGSPGARSESARTRLEVSNARIAGISPHGATLLWESPRQSGLAEIVLKPENGEARHFSPSFVFQIMGEYFDMTGMMPAYFSSWRHVALPDLQPDTNYEVTLTPLDASENRGNPVSLRFRTPRDYSSAAVYYVSPEGSDSANGLTRDAAWRSLAHALGQMAPGDELVVLPGIYREVLRPSVAGTKERPIRIRSEKPLAATLDLAANLPVAVEVLNTNHLEIDGFLISGGSSGRGNAFMISHAEDVTIRNCEIDYPEGSSFEKLKFGHGGLLANRAPGLKVENNLFLCGSVAVALSHAPGSIVRNNTILGEGNYGIVLVAGSENEPYTIQNNLFYRVVFGYKTGPLIFVFEPKPKLVSDHNLFYIPNDHKGTIGQLPETERTASLPEWQKVSGLDQNSKVAKPEFVDPAHRDFRLKSGSPGQNMADDGGVVGRRP